MQYFNFLLESTFPIYKNDSSSLSTCCRSCLSNITFTLSLSLSLYLIFILHDSLIFIVFNECLRDELATALTSISSPSILLFHPLSLYQCNNSSRLIWNASSLTSNSSVTSNLHKANRSSLICLAAMKMDWSSELENL